MINVVLLSLLPLIGWGVGDYIAARLSRTFNMFSLSLSMAIAGYLIAVPLCLAFGLPEVSLANFALFLSASLLFNSGFLLMLRGFHYGPVGIAAPIANSYALVTTLYALVFASAVVSFGILAGSAIIIGGIGLISYSKPKPGEFKSMRKTILYAVVAHILFGSAFIVLSHASVQEWYQNAVIYQHSNLLVAGTIWLFTRRSKGIKELQSVLQNKLMYIGGFVGAIGMVGMNLAFSLTDNIGVPTAIAAAAPLVTALCAYIFNKEHLTLLQRAATVCIVAGIVMLGVG